MFTVKFVENRSLRIKVLFQIIKQVHIYFESKSYHTVSLLFFFFLPCQIGIIEAFFPASSAGSHRPGNIILTDFSLDLAFFFFFFFFFFATNPRH